MTPSTGGLIVTSYILLLKCEDFIVGIFLDIENVFFFVLFRKHPTVFNVG